MKAYHSIEKNYQDYIGQFAFGFNKIDGSNFRAEWNRKLSKKSRFTNGFAKFGTRNEMIKNASNPFCEAIDIFKEYFSESLDKIFIDNKTFRGIDTITVYLEFFGKSSFAGQHSWDEQHYLSLFDVFMYKKDFVKPSDFLDIFGHLGTPHIVYQGILDESIIKDIVSNIYGLPEGVVFKGVIDKKVWMTKVKTQQWLDKVRTLYGINNNIE